MEDDTELVSLYTEEYENIYSNIRDIDKIDIKTILDKQEDTYALRELNNKHYMFISSHWSINNKIIYIVNAYDVEILYQEKDRQINSILVTDGIILVVSTLLISIVSIYLTRPINSLNKISKKIASGKFSERANIKTKDEIGELSSSFNVMAEQIDNKINELNLQVKQKNDFINGFTHELKTPMTAIVGYADLLRLKRCDEEVTKKALNYIYFETKRLENLAFKLMKLMSLTEEKLEITDFEVSDFINKIVKIENNILTQNYIELDIEKSIILGDSDLLEIVMRNLIENANKAEPRDKKITIKGKSLNNGKYRISVIDKGKGIPKEHIERVTEDFYMVDKSRSRINGGSGIGLSLVKKILNLHNSDINIESEVNIGTVVYFELEENVK
ncbi:MAG: HAMP domain-containing protein [Clostridia bacterium]|nr:HAMP domain-containing protein [Clostridia bacterium]